MLLAGDTQRLTAGGHDPDVGAVTKQRVSQGGATCQQVRAVVEDQQCLSRTKEIDQRGDWICAGRERHRDDRCQSLGDQRRVGYGRELDEPGAIGMELANTRVATASAKRVVPTPPTPVRVSSRVFV